MHGEEKKAEASTPAILLICSLGGWSLPSKVVSKDPLLQQPLPGFLSCLSGVSHPLRAGCFPCSLSLNMGCSSKLGGANLLPVTVHCLKLFLPSWFLLQRGYRTTLLALKTQLFDPLIS